MAIEEQDPGNPFLKSLDKFAKDKKSAPAVVSRESVDPFSDLPEKKKPLLQRLKAYLTNLYQRLQVT